MKKTNKNKGFTLLEILIAISILGIIMATIFGTFTGVISSSGHTEKRVELYQTGRAVMDLIAKDIRGILNTSGEEGLFFLGVIESVEGKSMSRMDFITTNSLSIGIDKNPFISEVGYRMKKGLKKDIYSLWRRAQSPPEYPYEKGGKEVPVCRIIEKFKLDFIFNNDIINDLQGSMPAAVIIDITLNQDGERENFITMVRPMSIARDRKSASPQNKGKS